MKDKRSGRGWLNRDVVGLGVTSFCTDASTEMILPVLPYFITRVLGASQTELGLIEGAAEAAATLLRPLAGYVSDRLRRRKSLALAGYTVSASVKPFLALATSWLHVLGLRVLDRFGKAFRNPPRDALLSSAVPSEARGRAFGFHRMMDTLGALVGSILALVLFPLLGYRNLFLLAAVPGFLGVLALAIMVRERAPPAPKPGRRRAPLRITKPLALLIAVTCILGFAGYSYAFLMVRATEVGFAVELGLALYVAYNATYALAAYPAGSLGDRVGRSLALGLGALLLVIASLAAIQPILVPVAFLVAGCSMAFRETMEKALVPSFTSEEERATAYGVVQGAKGLAALAGNTVFGFLYDYLGAAAAFTFAAVVAAAAIPVTLMLAKHEARSTA